MHNDRTVWVAIQAVGRAVCSPNAPRKENDDVLAWIIVHDRQCPMFPLECLSHRTIEECVTLRLSFFYNHGSLLVPEE